MELTQQALEALGLTPEQTEKILSAHREAVEQEQQRFAAYQAEQTEREARGEKEQAYQALLRSAGISEKRLDAILRVTDLDAMELENGHLQEEDTLRAAAREEWSDFLVSTRVTGAKTATPPETRQGLTREQILAIPDTGKRQRAIAENLGLFGV